MVKCKDLSMPSQGNRIILSDIKMPALQAENALEDTFGLWSAVSLGWLTLNVFGGLSFILFVGLAAGGLPVLLYGL